MSTTTQTKRLGRINVPTHITIYYALTKITGISYYLAGLICKQYALLRTTRVKDIDVATYEKLSNALNVDYYNLASTHKTYPLYMYVRYTMKERIKQKIRLHTEEGQNHLHGYRVHGQKRK